MSSEAGAPRALSRQRIAGLMLRHAYLYKHTFYRWVDIVYWPTVDLLVWGFLATYLQRRGGGVPRPVAFLLGALILWDILFRAQQSVSVGFLEDVWSRNVLNVWASPVRPGEYVLATVLVGAIRVTFGALVAILLAVLFYDFNFFSIGMSLIPSAIALVAMGWAIGIVTTAVILRFGEGAEVLAWALAFLFQPFSAVFYPVSILPGPMRAIAKVIPASHVFEAMRETLYGAGFPAKDLAVAGALDAAYLAAAWWFFARVMRTVRARGLLSRFGE